MLDDHIKRLVSKRGLSPLNQKRCWARTTEIKSILIKNGMTTAQEFDSHVDSMVQDINAKVEESIRKNVGAEEENVDAGKDKRGG